MNDILKYKPPGKEIVDSVGVFKTISSFDNVKGFVVSPFCSNEKFIFVDSESLEQKYHFNDNNPYIHSQSEYLKIGHNFVNQIKEKKLSKAILSRIKQVDFNVDVTSFFYALCEAYPDAFVYLISSPLFGTWVGASPEVLIESSGKEVKTMALAGTLPVGDQNWGDKESKEQQYVTDFLVDCVKEVGGENLIIDPREEVAAGPVKHLRTSLSFTIHKSNLLPFVDLIHPTPAVSGLPQKESLELIGSAEVQNRELYTGYLGLVEEDKSLLFVNLRCAQISGDKMYLYLGGGYTKDSDVMNEWIETENKAKTLLNILENM